MIIQSGPWFLFNVNVVAIYCPSLRYSQSCAYTFHSMMEFIHPRQTPSQAVHWSVILNGSHYWQRILLDEWWVNLWCLTVLQIFWQFKYSLAPPDNIEVSMSDGSVFRNLLTISFIVQKLGFLATRIADNLFPEDRILVGSPSTYSNVQCHTVCAIFGRWLIQLCLNQLRRDPDQLEACGHLTLADY